MKCAIYVRVSTEEQAKKYSIPAQLDLLRSFAQINNYEIFKEYIDEGISGTISDRPQLRELFNDAGREYFKIILVYRIDRFFRNTRGLLNAVGQLQEIGVSFKSITEPFDTSTPMGSFMISLLGSIAQLERDMLIERTKMGILKSVREGHYRASEPLYGYKYNRETKKLEINPEESKIVKLIFKLYQEPHSSEARTTEKLNNMGTFCRRGSKWRKTQTHRVLTHSGYCGKWYYTSGSEKIMINIPSLISENTFNEVQKLLKKRKIHSKRNQKHNYLLLNHLYCGSCKRRMSARTKKFTTKYKDKVYGPYFWQHYYCFGRTLKKGCEMKWIGKDKIELLVWGEVKKYIKNPALIKRIVQENSKKDRNKLVLLKRELVKIASKLEKLELENEKILHLYRKNIITEDQLHRQIEEIKIEKQALDQRRTEINLEIENDKYLKTKLYTLEKFIKKIQSNTSNLTFEKKKEIIDLLIDKIFIKENGGVELQLIIPDFYPIAQRQS